MMRRRDLFSLAASGAVIGAFTSPAGAQRGTATPSVARRYADPSTELEVYRLTDPAFTSELPAYYQRVVSRRSGFLIFSSTRGGTRQGYRIDLKSYESRQITEAGSLDPTSLTLAGNDSGFCHFDGRKLFITPTNGGKGRELYEVPDNVRRTAGVSVSDDGQYAIFCEVTAGKSGSRGRIQVVRMGRGDAATAFEGPGEFSQPLIRPKHPQILYRLAGDLWLADLDGRNNRKLPAPNGIIGPARWAPGGFSVLYLLFPEEPHSLPVIREYFPDEKSDKAIGKTSQYAHFGCNGDSSVFVGASSSKASPMILIMLRANRRELALCEHRASIPAAVAPIFSADSKSIFFNSDRHGRPAIYRVHVDDFVEETEE